MPRANNYNNKPSWKGQYIEHDFRSNNNHRVPFKHGRREHQKDWSSSIRHHLLEEDVDMAGFSASSSMKNINHKKNSQYKKGGGGGGGGNRRGSPAPHMQQKRKLPESPNGWYRVTLPYGTKYNREFLQRLLSDKVNPVVFAPISWVTNGPVCTFYIDDFRLANKLHMLDRQLAMPDGFRLVIRVNSGTPNVDMTTEMKEKMKLTMAKRYNVATKALDLSKFHTDPDLQEYFCTLFKPGVFSAVVDIIGENIRDIEALNLDDNKLPNVFYPKKFAENAPNLKILHLAKNKIRELSIFDNLSSLPIVELVLDGNPVCGRFKEQSAYISEIRKRFPKVMKLDGVGLEPPISFDLDESFTLPSTQQTFLCSADGHGIVRQFLEQYVQVFDSEDREPLRQAYDQNAMFSMTMAYPYGTKDKNQNFLNWYSIDSRNLLRVEDTTRRQKLLKCGNINIVEFLKAMPTTKHDIHSFTVDLTLFTPQMLCLTVGGIFKEIRSNHKQSMLRHFHRTLVIVPSGGGFCIANETFHITNPTETQAKNAFKIPVPEVIVHPPTPVVSPNASLNEAQTAATPVLDQSIQIQMVQALSAQSGMNLEWSKKCLEETQWNFERAVTAFHEAQKQGLIPPDAFVK